MITKLSLSNFKGHNGSFELGSATMIVGDNFRGKSGIFQGIALGVHGWLKHPGGDKKLDPFGLASGNPMAIRLQGSYGDCSLDLRRRWERDNRGSVRYSGYDGLPLCPPIFLDARTYFDLSADKRMRFVFGAVKLADGEFSSAKLIADLKNLKADTHTEAHEEALRDVVAKVVASWATFDEKTGTIQDWLAKQIDALKESSKLAKQAVDRMTKTVAGITELQVRDTTEIDANTAALEHRADELRKQIEGKVEEVARVEQRGKVAREQSAKFQRLRDEIAKLPTVDEAVLATEAQVSAACERITNEGNALSKELGRVESELMQANDATVKQAKIISDLAEVDAKLEEYPDQSAAITNLQFDLEQMRFELGTVEETQNQLRQELDPLFQPLSDLKAKLSAQERIVSETEEKLDTIETSEQCPWCACAGDAFKTTAVAHFESLLTASKTNVETMSRMMKQAEKAISDLRSKITEEGLRHKNLKANIADREQRIGRHESSMSYRKVLEGRREELLKQSAPPLDIAATDSALNVVRQKILQNNQDAITNSKALVNVTSMKRAKELSDQMMEIRPENPDELADQWRKLQAEKADSNAALIAVDTQIKQGIAAKADALRQNQAVAERDKAKAEQDMLKLAVECVTGFQQSMVDKAFGQIITDANRFVEGILDSPLVYQDGEIGRIRNGTFVGHEYLSGTEQALCFAGISVALAMQSPFRLVMIDEMTRLSRRNKIAVLDRMLCLIRTDIIHQFIGVDTDITPYRELADDRQDDIRFIEL